MYFVNTFRKCVVYIFIKLLENKLINSKVKVNDYMMFSECFRSYIKVIEKI